ncbi:winged helix-turn-helix transcriptional regulator [Myxococcota bacterium]|nr:winged helix-turn-helix transcriptional regulator [Myxococcota bacterium]
MSKGFEFETYRECREHDIEAPEYDPGMAGLMLTFHANPQHLAGVSEKASEKTSEKILELLKKNPVMALSEVAKSLNKSARAVEMQVANLKDKGRLKRIGPDKGGHWEVVGMDDDRG